MPKAPYAKVLKVKGLTALVGPSRAVCINNAAHSEMNFKSSNDDSMPKHASQGVKQGSRVSELLYLSRHSLSIRKTMRGNPSRQHPNVKCSAVRTHCNPIPKYQNLPSLGPQASSPYDSKLIPRSQGGLKSKSETSFRAATRAGYGEHGCSKA